MIDPEGFEAMYRADPDPFRVASSWYERRKQAVLLASLSRERYRPAWDAASGTGVLARALLADGRCEHLVATDASPTAVDLTAGRVAGWPAASVLVSALPAVPPQARDADLTVVAEVLFYLPDEARAEAVRALAAQAGELVTVHWRHHPHDAHLSGTDVTAELDVGLRAGGWTPAVRHDDTDFVLATWLRAPSDADARRSAE